MSIRLTLAASSTALALIFSPLAQAQQSAGAPPAAATTEAPAAAAPAPKAEMAAAGDAMEGKIAYYGRKFAGRKTASGQRFNPNALTMAHRTLPFGTKVKVTNIKNNKSVVVRVNDRGPTSTDRIGDLSRAAAAKIGMIRSGVVEAKLETVSK